MGHVGGRGCTCMCVAVASYPFACDLIAEQTACRSPECKVIGRQGRQSTHAGRRSDRMDRSVVCGIRCSKQRLVMRGEWNRDQTKECVSHLISGKADHTPPMYLTRSLRAACCVHVCVIFLHRTGRCNHEECLHNAQSAGDVAKLELPAIHPGTNLCPCGRAFHHCAGKRITLDLPCVQTHTTFTGSANSYSAPVPFSMHVLLRYCIRVRARASARSWRTSQMGWDVLRTCCPRHRVKCG